MQWRHVRSFIVNEHRHFYLYLTSVRRLIDLDMSDHFTLQSSSGCSAATRGNPYKMLVNHCRINVRNIFSERLEQSSIVSFKSLLSFRNSLGNVNLGLYTKYWSLFFNLFLLPMYLVFTPDFVCFTVTCMYLQTMWHVSGVIRPLLRWL